MNEHLLVVRVGTQNNNTLNVNLGIVTEVAVHTEHTIFRVGELHVSDAILHDADTVVQIKAARCTTIKTWGNDKGEVLLAEFSCGVGRFRTLSNDVAAFVI